MPKIFIREKIDSQTMTVIKEVVDGQQRLSIIFAYMNNEFKVSKKHHEHHSKLFYKDLPDEVKKQFMGYEIAVENLYDAPDNEVLDVFARLNSYSAPLQKQELRNAITSGDFKVLAIEVANAHTTFWEENRIFLTKSIVRMRNVEITAELLIAMIDGIQGGKNYIDSYYKKYETIKDPEKYQSQFDSVLSTISDIFGGDLKNTKFKTSGLFYDLFCAIYHHEFGLKDLGVRSKKLVRKKFPEIKKCLLKTSKILEEGNTNGIEETQYFKYSKGATTDKPRRIYRVKYLAKSIANCI